MLFFFLTKVIQHRCARTRGRKLAHWEMEAQCMWKLPVHLVLVTVCSREVQPGDAAAPPAAVFKALGALGFLRHRHGQVACRTPLMQTFLWLLQQMVTSTVT